MDRITILYFGPARERTGTESESIELKPGTTVGDVKQSVRERFPDMSDFIDACRIAVDLEYVPEDFALESGAEVAVIPPVAGG